MGGDRDYVPRSILVTGSAGFIASHFVTALVTRHPEYNVISYDKCAPCSSIRNLDAVKDRPNHKFVKGDILDADLVAYILKEENVDTIVHLAAYSHVDTSFEDPMAFTMNNVVGTHVLLECARQHGGIKRFMHISTDEVYGEVPHGTPSPEEDSAKLDPTNPYAASKAGAEHMVDAYRHSYGMPTIITRGNNVYGPNQYPEKLIPKFISRMKKGLPCCIHGDGSARRMFLHVRDVADALITVMHRGQVGQSYNVGCDDEKSVMDVAHAIAAAMGQELNAVHVADRLFNDCRYAVDHKKLRALGWEPKVTWEEGLAETVNWYLENLEAHWGDRVDRAVLKR